MIRIFMPILKCLDYNFPSNIINKILENIRYMIYGKIVEYTIEQ
jgi:hypothetical protein